jgi:hypothetical protein
MKRAGRALLTLLALAKICILQQRCNALLFFLLPAQHSIASDRHMGARQTAP